MREFHITATWESSHVIEIPDDYVIDEDNLFDSAIDLEDISASTASLVDWDIKIKGVEG